MKLEIEINEDKILELAQSDSISNLPYTIFSQLKNTAIQIYVDEIKRKIVEKDYYSNKENLQKEVKELLISQINESITKFVSDKFSESKIQNIIDIKFNSLINEWINNKIETKLEEAKADIMFVKQSDIENGDYNN